LAMAVAAISRSFGPIGLAALEMSLVAARNRCLGKAAIGVRYELVPVRTGTNLGSLPAIFKQLDNAIEQFQVLGLDLVDLRLQQFPVDHTDPMNLNLTSANTYQNTAYTPAKAL
jgi:hypothetical protein